MPNYTPGRRERVTLRVSCLADENEAMSPLDKGFNITKKALRHLRVMELLQNKFVLVSSSHNLTAFTCISEQCFLPRIVNAMTPVAFFCTYIYFFTKPVEHAISKSSLSLFQNKSWSETFHIKMSLSCKKKERQFTCVRILYVLSPVDSLLSKARYVKNLNTIPARKRATLVTMCKTIKIKTTCS